MRSDTPNQKYVDTGSHKICLHEWEGSGPTFLFLHATGFHGRIWDYIIKRFPDRHVLAWDMRSHGLSENAELPQLWTELGEDLYAVVEALNLNQIYGVGHSCGGHLALLAAAKFPDLFKELLLLDPVVFPKSLLPMFEQFGREEHPVARRRPHWDSAGEMYEKFKDRKPYNTWVPDILEDYCQHGLHPSDSGEGYTLACPPDAEAQVYRTCYGDQIYPLLGQIQVPSTIVRARRRRPDEPAFDFSPSPTWEQLAENLPNATDIHVPDHTHFMPMENPEAILNMMVQMEQGKKLSWQGAGVIKQDA
ncbi:3-oxoadipate enol-lactonase 2 [Pseudovibrio axinellae]|uniref:3-oxoadipate enol-lactonase 2 n=1 Tax=Pseudovibrio axinellae TaxID=989403 RepID=A0A165YAW2_9HYPH|nr:alpha/beta hydrolase [Pseudovibrio axinellae]KZL18624.1 3-oxoadipate enol-lactonase 2 [Pseudovibrio axinellae]SER74125.1 Pimeloyl-ACP methyl ester carboxylesterase [Pseudovibrio axinellae]